MNIYSTLPDGTQIIDGQFLLDAYCNGIFPMAEGKDGELRWFSPEQRGIIPLDGLKISRSLRQTMRKNLFEIRFDGDFEGTIRACAEREDVWISELIIQSYLNLFRHGFAHSVECWNKNSLVGGLYGVSIGGAFFGESMFSRMNNTSKIALVALVNRLNEKGYSLLDTQYINSHLATLGCIEIPKEEYLQRLNTAVQLECNFS